MGCNYYVYKKISNDKKEELIQKLQDDKYEEVVSEVQSLSPKIHIGKQSYGWQFIFNANRFRYYQPNKEDIDKFLRDENMVFVDEYDKVVSVDDFWEMVDKNKEKMNNEEYYTKSKDEREWIYWHRDKYDEILQPYKPNFFEFYSDNLRFSTSDSFS